jgi:small subunit ribosomal protein S20
MRTSAAARLRNRRDRSSCRTMEKTLMDLKSRTEAQTALKAAFELFDRMSAKGVLHKNTAARHKAKLSRFVSTLSV